MNWHGHIKSMNLPHNRWGAWLKSMTGKGPDMRAVEIKCWGFETADEARVFILQLLNGAAIKLEK